MLRFRGAIVVDGLTPALFDRLARRVVRGELLPQRSRELNHYRVVDEEAPEPDLATTIDVGQTGITSYGLDLSPGLSTPNQGGTADGIAIDANKVYFALETSSIRSFDRGTLLVQTNLAAQATPAGVAVDDNFVFWTIMRVDKQGIGAPVFLFSGPAGPYGIAVDSQAVYWTNTQNGTVMKLAKPLN